MGKVQIGTGLVCPMQLAGPRSEVKCIREHCAWWTSCGCALVSIAIDLRTEQISDPQCEFRDNELQVHGFRAMVRTLGQQIKWLFKGSQKNEREKIAEKRRGR